MPENEHDNHEHEHAGPSGPPIGPGQPAQDVGSQALTSALKVSFRFLKWAMVVLVIAYLATGVFKVNVNEVKFKLLFGEIIPYKSTAPLRSGLHLRWPWEEVVTVPTDEKVLTLDSEFWSAGKKGAWLSRVQSLSVRHDGYLITGDANIVHMKVRVIYQVKAAGDSAAAYVFLIQQPSETLRRMVEAATVKVVGSMHVMDVLQHKGLLDGIQRELDRRLEAFHKSSGVPLGIVIRAVQAPAGQNDNFMNPTEPGATYEAFANAQNALSKASASISKGKSEAINIHNKAEADAAALIAAATADKIRMVSAAKADAAEMQQLLPIYEHSTAEANLLLEDFYQRKIVDMMQQSPGAFVLHRMPPGARQQLRFYFTRAPYLPSKKPASTGSAHPGAPGSSQ